MSNHPQETFIDDKAASVYSSKGEVSDDDVRSDHQAPFIKSDAEKRLVKKINWTLLPYVGAIVFIQFVDKSTLGISAVLGIIQDTHMTGTQYSWLGSFFYLGYILFQLPNNYFIQKFPINRYLGTLLVLWGIVMGCTALCSNFTQLVICRVLLGLFEAGTYPCLLILINTIYRRSEQSAAYGFLWQANGSGTMVGAACAYGISYINNANGIHSWKWPYIIWGALTVLFGIIVFFTLPDTPHSFMFRLTEEEKKIVQERTKDNAVVKVYEVKMKHVWEALAEPRLWLLCLSTLCNNLHTGGLVVFSTLLTKGFGFSVSTYFKNRSLYLPYLIIESRIDSASDPKWFLFCFLLYAGCLCSAQIRSTVSWCCCFINYLFGWRDSFSCAAQRWY
jgi:MFS family permease